MQSWRAPAFESAFNPFIRFVRFRKLASCALFALIGCVVSLKASAGFIVYLILACAGTLMAALFYRRKRRISAFLILICVMLLFASYTQWRNQRPEIVLNKKGDVTGVISSRPVYQMDKNRTLLYLEDASVDGEAVGYGAYVYIYGNNESAKFEYGQTLYLPVAGLWIPDGRTNPDGFDFNAYLWRKGVAFCASSSVSKTEILSEKASLTRGLYRLNRYLSERFETLFPTNAHLMRALLLGDRSGLSDETYESFQEAGIAHLVALSGLHVSCVAMFIEVLLMMFLIPAKPRGVITMAVIFLYTIMTGASASLMRAAMMYALLVAGRFTGHPSDLLTRLSCAFLIQLAINPLTIQDTGMQLSYLSVLSLALMHKPICALFPLAKTNPDDGESVLFIIYSRFVNAVSASCAIQMGTLPAMASLFHSVPVLSVPVNLIVVPLGLISVYIGASSLVVSFASMPAAVFLGKIADGVWTAILFLTDWISGLSFAMINARAWSVWIILAYILLMALASPYITEKRGLSSCLTAVSAALAVAVLVWPRPVHEGLELVFLDAGYADSCAILADNNTYVYDCGKDNEITADYLTSRGSDVKGIFISHPDIDHAGGIREILKRYPDAEIYVSECWNRMDVGELVSDAISKSTIHYLSAGDAVSLSDGITAHVVWPEKGFEPKEDNDGSLVIHIVYNEASALLTGDITGRVDKYIDVDADILKVAHHGSKMATSEALLCAVTPRISVISVSSNGHGHPTEEVLMRLSEMNSEVYRTDECGAITIGMFEDGTYEIKTELP